MAQRIRISQCMIVKNEEKNIKRALSWGKDIMSEQIVVDTGSTDRTVEIAKQMGAKVFQFPWVDDFSAAKNYAIDRAKGNWIIFLDADEYMSPKDVQKIPSMLREINPTSHTALVTSWVQVNSDADLSQDQAEGSLKWVPTVTTDGSQHMSLSGSVMRIFRRLPELRYQGRIHEKLYLKFDKPDSLDVSKELAVFHTGYNPDWKNFQVKIRDLILNDGISGNAATLSMSQEMLKSAVVIVVVFPFLIIYPFVQKYFTKGITLGAVKG